MTDQIENRNAATIDENEHEVARDEARQEMLTRQSFDNYRDYQPICMEPGREQIRLLQILPAKGDDDDERLRCVLFNAPASWNKIVYVALSYCWGNSSNFHTIDLIHHDPHLSAWASSADDGETLFSVDDEIAVPFTVGENLYQALRSIRKSTPRLTEKYPVLDHQPLWIDAICINQGAIEERTSQVKIMGNVYSNAFFVWIWLGEAEDTMRGLNLIEAMMIYAHEKWGSEFDSIDPKDEHIRDFFAARYKLEDEIMDPETCFQLLERLFHHDYFRRIWVLQEATRRAERTFVQTSIGQLSWRAIIVANRFRKLWRKIYPSFLPENLPVMWAPMIHARLSHVKRLLDQGHVASISDGLGFSIPLYTLFINTYEAFQATDLRDKLYALLGLAEETHQGIGLDSELIPDYGKSTSRVFGDFTRWCIRQSGNLDILSLLSGGPRRFPPSNKMAKTEPNSDPPPLDHPSWAIWPTTGGYWTQSSLIKINEWRKKEFDLAYAVRASIPDMVDIFPSTSVPAEIQQRLLPLAGVEIGVVKSILRMPLRCFEASGSDDDKVFKYHWISKDAQDDLEKHEKKYTLALTHPYEERSLMRGSFLPLWDAIKRGETAAVLIEDNLELLESSSQEWLGGTGGRYKGNEEIMFRDFLETLLLDPIYRGINDPVPEMDDHRNDSDKGIPHGPWDNPTIATSFTLHWAQNDSGPRLAQVPPRIAEYLRDHVCDVGILRQELFPFQFLAHGKCLFITEDERMGLCPVDTQIGDVIVAMPGSAVPLVLHPLLKEGLDGDGLEQYEMEKFEGDEDVRRRLFRFMGECYLHGRMTGEFLVDLVQQDAEIEAFVLV